MDQNNNSNKNWKSLSKTDLIIFGAGFALGCYQSLSNTYVHGNDSLSTIDYFTNGLYFTVPLGIVRSVRFGIEVGIKSGSIGYAGHLLGETLTEIIKNSFR